MKKNKINKPASSIICYLTRQLNYRELLYLYIDMSQSESYSQGVYKQGDQVIVVLPSDKVVIIQQIHTQTPPGVQRPVEHHHSPLQTIQQKIHSLFQHKQPQKQVLVVEKPVVVVQTATPVQQSQTNFSAADIKRYWSNCRQTWRTFDSEAAFHMTQFKRQYVLPIGDIPVRTICMAVSTGLVYTILGRRNPNFFVRTRNLAASFLINGIFWLPQSFNPFLLRKNRV